MVVAALTELVSEDGIEDLRPLSRGEGEAGVQEVERQALVLRPFVAWLAGRHFGRGTVDGSDSECEMDGSEG